MSDDFPIIYFLDEEESQRHLLKTALKVLFGTTHQIEPMPVLPEMQDYLMLLDAGNVSAVFIDQQLDQTGVITGFTGVQLAEFLRQHFPSMPIYVVTGHKTDSGELISEKAGSTDAVISKTHLAIGSPHAPIFKQQFLRRLERYNEAMTSRQLRFRELLAKSLQTELTSDERAELEQMKAERLIPTASAESAAEEQTRKETSAISSLLTRVEELLKQK